MTDFSATSGEVVVTGTDGRDSPSGEAFDPQAFDPQRLCELAVVVLKGEGIDRGQLDLHFVDPDTIAELNVEHLGHVGPTDVLSFPIELDPFSPDELLLLGDVVLCPAVAAAQASDHVGTAKGEFELLVIHGVLHVLGHDHAEEAETIVMQQLERSYLATLGVAHPVTS